MDGEDPQRVVVGLGRDGLDHAGALVGLLLHPLDEGAQTDASPASSHARAWSSRKRIRRQWSRGRRRAMASSNIRRSRTTASTVSLTRAPPASVASGRGATRGRRRPGARVAVHRVPGCGSPSGRPTGSTRRARRRCNRTQGDRSEATTAISSVGSSIAVRIASRSRTSAVEKTSDWLSTRAGTPARSSASSSVGERRCATGSGARCRSSTRRAPTPVTGSKTGQPSRLIWLHERRDVGRLAPADVGDRLPSSASPNTPTDGRRGSQRLAERDQVYVRGLDPGGCRRAAAGRTRGSRSRARRAPTGSSGRASCG